MHQSVECVGVRSRPITLVRKICSCVLVSSRNQAVTLRCVLPIHKSAAAAQFVQVEVQVASVRVVYIAEILLGAIVFGYVTGDGLLGVLNPPKKKIESSQEEESSEYPEYTLPKTKMSIDVQVKSPLIMMPRNRSHKDCLLVRLGDLGVTNSFNEQTVENTKNAKQDWSGVIATQTYVVSLQNTNIMLRNYETLAAFDPQVFWDDENWYTLLTKAELKGVPVQDIPGTKLIVFVTMPINLHANHPAAVDMPSQNIKLDFEESEIIFSGPHYSRMMQVIFQNVSVMDNPFEWNHNLSKHLYDQMVEATADGLEEIKKPMAPRNKLNQQVEVNITKLSLVLQDLNSIDVICATTSDFCFKMNRRNNGMELTLDMPKFNLIDKSVPAGREEPAFPDMLHPVDENSSAKNLFSVEYSTLQEEVNGGTAKRVKVSVLTV